MKKLYTFAFVALSAIAVNAQTNLVTNGGFETWTAGVPENFAPVASPSINNFLTQEATIKHSGSFSAAHQSQSSAQYLEGSQLITVIPGHTYTLSYWYFDNSDTAKTRIWSSWLPADNTTALTDDVNVLRVDTPESYSVNSDQWVQKTLNLTAPAAAGRFRFQVRTYREATGADGGYVYYDDFSFVDTTAPAGVANNQIAGLKMFPNPNTGDVLNITTTANATKSVAIFDVLGKQVVNTTTANSTVNVSGLTAGVYIVKITEEGKTATRKLVKQ